MSIESRWWVVKGGKVVTVAWIFIYIESCVDLSFDVEFFIKKLLSELDNSQRVYRSCSSVLPTVETTRLFPCPFRNWINKAERVGKLCEIKVIPTEGHAFWRERCCGVQRTIRNTVHVFKAFTVINTGILSFTPCKTNAKVTWNIKVTIRKRTANISHGRGNFILIEI